MSVNTQNNSYKSSVHRECVFRPKPSVQTIAEKNNNKKKQIPPGVVEESAVPERMLSSLSAVEKT